MNGFGSRSLLDRLQVRCSSLLIVIEDSIYKEKHLKVIISCSLCDINECKIFRVLCSCSLVFEDPTEKGPTSGIRAFGLDIIRITVQYSRFDS